MIVVLSYECFDTQTQWKQLAITILALTTRFDKLANTFRAAVALVCVLF